MVCNNCGDEIDTSINGDEFVSFSVTPHECDRGSFALSLCEDCNNELGIERKLAEVNAE